MLAGLVLAGLGTVSELPAQAVEVTVLNDLTFGDVLAGSTRLVAHSHGDAAKFLVQGPSRAPVTVTFTLPSHMMAGDRVLPVAFGGVSAAWGLQDRATGRTQFDPAAGTSVQLAANGRLFVWLGGEVAPPVSQQYGGYAGHVTLHVDIEEP